MPELDNQTPSLQFETAEFAYGGHCAFCKGSAGSGCYRINGNVACAACAGQVRSTLPADSHGAFMRALLFGFGGALVGLTLYATFEILTNLTIGYLALAVGWIVATAMMKGSRGIGGRRYQIAAVLFTYFAVSVAAIPVFFHQLSKEKALKADAQKTAISQPAPATTDSATMEAPATEAAPVPAPADSAAAETPATEATPAPAPKPAKERMGFFTAMTVLIGIGLASPLLEFSGGNPFSAVIGLVILFVGLRIAWRIAAGMVLPEIEGPF